ncbi:hypothetical protein FOL47_007539 [Perkinsus chesapeaki]|uniref:EFHB C-terminal EF-hand domain-containing protein n=1 Tax=Perkinsus chesapeaki TaxID=330153 RepID=A0A7J6MVF0_PERCH|nr:hypothetical protein FOL47_007539 [Perkinsus chesapeaki]
MSDEPVGDNYTRMVSQGKIRIDPITIGIRPAGKSIAVFDDSAECDLQPDIYFPVPPTPAEQRKYRRDYEPGKMNVHWGMVGLDHAVDPKRITHGIKSLKGENAERTMKAQERVGVAAYMDECAEQVYASTKREPLGKSYVRGHDLPPATKDSSFKGFGYKPPDSDYTAKESIFPVDVAREETASVKDRYRFTHKNYQCGEVINRDYAWPDETRDPFFRFGKMEKIQLAAGQGAKQALTWNAVDEKTRIVGLRAEAAREVVNEPLGEAKNLMQGALPVPEGFVFGVKSGNVKANSTDNITAADCIHYNALSEKEILADPDLGKCMKRGKRNVTDESRQFGCPSIRHDIPKPTIRSVADIQNYGDEVGCDSLLHPQRYVGSSFSAVLNSRVIWFESMGVTDDQFLQRRSKEELRSIMKIVLPNTYAPDDASKDALFEELWPEATAVFGDNVGMASLDSFFYVFTKLVINPRVKQETTATIIAGALLLTLVLIPRPYWPNASLYSMHLNITAWAGGVLEDLPGGITVQSEPQTEYEPEHVLNTSRPPETHSVHEISLIQQSSIDLPSKMFPEWDSDAYFNGFYGGDIDRSFWLQSGILHTFNSSRCKLARVKAALESGSDTVRLLFIGCSMSQGVHACGKSSGIDICPGCEVEEKSAGRMNATCSSFEGCVRQGKYKKNYCGCCSWISVWYRWLKLRYPKADLRPHKVGCKRGCNALVAASSLNSDLRNDNLWPLEPTDLVVVDLSACELVADGLKLDIKYGQAQITTVQKLHPATVILALHSPVQIPGFSSSGLRDIYSATAEATETSLWAWQGVAEKLGDRLARTGPESWPHPPWPLHFLIADFMAILWESETNKKSTLCENGYPEVAPTAVNPLTCDDVPPESAAVFSADALLDRIRAGTAGPGWGTNGGSIHQSSDEWQLYVSYGGLWDVVGFDCLFVKIS